MLNKIKQYWSKNKVRFVKRLKSYLWRAGIGVGLLIIGFVSDFVDSEEKTIALMIVAYGVNEVTKVLNKKKIELDAFSPVEIKETPK